MRILRRYVDGKPIWDDLGPGAASDSRAGLSRGTLVVGYTPKPSPPADSTPRIGDKCGAVIPGGTCERIHGHKKKSHATRAAMDRQNARHKSRAA